MFISTVNVWYFYIANKLLMIKAEQTASVLYSESWLSTCKLKQGKVSTLIECFGEQNYWRRKLLPRSLKDLSSFSVAPSVFIREDKFSLYVDFMEAHCPQISLPRMDLAWLVYF
ncbi:hypothetical protein ATANTOWER_026651 [Ataeniobius toweri]|uniref:Uncharacterized protein n=1 Tax=Ataeniobius toweri TaxID=208326 RepID=A0ABU7AU55_9TELE|nr:hypothetical protein [Ataeniobius toweri]